MSHGGRARALVEVTAAAEPKLSPASQRAMEAGDEGTDVA